MRNPTHACFGHVTNILVRGSDHDSYMSCNDTVPTGRFTLINSNKKKPRTQNKSHMIRTSNYPASNNNTRRNTNQVAYAQYVGSSAASGVPAVEAEAVTVPIASTYGSANTPIVEASLIPDKPKKDSDGALPPFSQALNSPSRPLGQATQPPTTSTTTSFPPSGVSTLTGDEYLKLLKEDRKRSTVSSGILGGAVGLLFLGPVGAVLGGTVSAVVTKTTRKRHERILREHWRQQGLLDKPVGARINL